MSSGYVLFRLAGRTFATGLDVVREIVRLEGLQVLPGARPPMAGVTTLRGTPLPVLDVRAGGEAGAVGDVLVAELGDDVVGVAVDAVLAVLRPEELPEAGPAPRSLPSYVVGVGAHRDGPVLLVDLRRLLDTVTAGRALVS